MANQLKGTLGDISALRVFLLINLTRRTGTYHRYQKTSAKRNARTTDSKAVPKEIARISFEQGALIHATTTGPESHLLSVLYKAGKLNQTQYNTFLKASTPNRDKALALSLINAGYLTRRDILQSMRQHMLDVVYSTLASTEDEFVFEEGELPPSDSITVWINTENVIAEHSRRLRELNELAQVVPNLNLVLRYAKVVGAKSSTLKLAQDEWHVLSLVNARDSIGQIAATCHMTETEIRRVVSTLIRAGLVEPVAADSRKLETNLGNLGTKPLIPRFWSKPSAPATLEG